MALAINFFLVFLLVAALTMASPLLGPKKTMEGDKGLPYETGMKPMPGRSGGRVWASYYRYAILFVVFDVDLAFLAPWLYSGARADLPGLAALTVFMGLVGFTLAYVWRKGALEC